MDLLGCSWLIHQVLSPELSRALGELLGPFAAPYHATAIAKANDVRRIDELAEIQHIAICQELAQRLGVRDILPSVPRKVTGRILFEGLVEDDPQLAMRWAALLVRAVDAESEVEIRRSYVSILADMTPAGCLIIDKIYALDFYTHTFTQVATADLPLSAKIWIDQHRPSEPDNDIAIEIAQLVRLGLLALCPTWEDQQAFCSVMPTLLGREFARAVRVPDYIGDPSQPH